MFALIFIAAHTYSVEVNQFLDMFLRRIRAINLDLVFYYEFSEVRRQLARLASHLIDFMLRIVVQFLHQSRVRVDIHVDLHYFWGGFVLLGGAPATPSKPFSQIHLLGRLLSLSLL
jgi:hypothetical protein